jgi:hypothetical protein
MDTVPVVADEANELLDGRQRAASTGPFALARIYHRVCGRQPWITTAAK